MFKARIEVTLKAKILDPQGKAIESSLHNLGFLNVSRVRTGKNIELFVEVATLDDAVSAVRLACEKLLANPVTEEYESELFSADGISLARFSSRDKSPRSAEKAE